jgi:FtsH-binding integral membrane protein
MSYAMEHPIAIRAQESARAGFIRRTYAHLAGAILAFVALEMVLFQVVLPTPNDRLRVLEMMIGRQFSWLIVVGAFIGVSWLADMWARSDVSSALQYLGLGLYVAAQAAIFVPLLIVAVDFTNDPNIIPTAGIMTLAMFAGLTVSVFMTGKDYSFLRPIISMASFIAFGFIIAAMIFGFSLGLVFMFALVALASACILYQTSNVLHHYRTDQHVAAALALFALVALLFYYILMILIQLNSNRR